MMVFSLLSLGAIMGIRTPSLVFFALGILFLLIVWIVIMRTTPQYCCNCHKRVRRFDQLSKEQQRLIRSHFIEQENRQVDDSGVFVCLACRYMHDDFSGEKHNRDAGSSYNGLSFRRHVQSSKWRTICKVCDVIMQPCDPGCEDIHCPRCETHYTWVKHEKLNLYILTAEGDAKILKSCSHHFGIA